MKYLPPEPKINLYNQGFEPDDFLGRAQTGRQLSELVEKIDDPFVLALDGVWGSGKSHFLKCWVGAHKLENDGNATTVYIDAFQHDFLEEPLIALTSAISSRLVGNPKSSKAWQVAKTAAAKLWRPVARIGLAAGTAGLSEVAGVIVDAGLAATGAELQKQVDAFWLSEESKSAAMTQFRSALIELTEPDKADDPPKKLVVVIDELDRCRPDYALSMLEVVKHFFNVSNVHFVIGVNLTELQNSVRARYGAGVDAQVYLEKFINFSINLPDIVSNHGITQPSSLAYYERTAAEMNLDPKLVEEVLWYFSNFNESIPLSLRGIQKILTQIALVPLPKGGGTELAWGERFLICGILIMKFSNRGFYSKARKGILAMDDVIELFGIIAARDDDEEFRNSQINKVWASCLKPDSLGREAHANGMWGRFGLHSHPDQIIPKTIRKYLETIVLTNSN